jgi:hypothetical protein
MMLVASAILMKIIDPAAYNSALCFFTILFVMVSCNSYRASEEIIYVLTCAAQDIAQE